MIYLKIKGISSFCTLIFFTLHLRWGQIGELDIKYFDDAFGDDHNDNYDHKVNGNDINNTNDDLDLIDIISNWEGKDILDKYGTQN